MGLIDMNISNLRRVIAVLFVILVITPGWAAAIRPTSALYDNTGISTTIDATCIGTFIVNHDMSWEQTNNPLGNLSGGLTSPETRAIFSYRENTLAGDGTTKYTKDYNMQGSNVSEGRDNLNVVHQINFETDQSGGLIFDEEATITMHGTAASADDVGRCVFAAGSGSGTGGFDGTVAAGSVMMVQEVAAVTQVGGRAISETSSVPVNLRYGFDAQGLGTENNTLAKGAAEVFMNTRFDVHDLNDLNLTTKIDDRQRTMASGLFDLAQTHEYTSTF